MTINKLRLIQIATKYGQCYNIWKRNNAPPRPLPLIFFDGVPRENNENDYCYYKRMKVTFGHQIGWKASSAALSELYNAIHDYDGNVRQDSYCTAGRIFDDSIDYEEYIEFIFSEDLHVLGH
jgi:hypothetical protein